MKNKILTTIIPLFFTDDVTIAPDNVMKANDILAQNKKCENCEFNHKNMGTSADGGHCYMFREIMLDCTQFKPAKIENTNVKFGFDDTTQFEKKFPGTIEFSCEYCGIYTASKPRCNKCEKDF